MGKFVLFLRAPRCPQKRPQQDRLPLPEQGQAQERIGGDRSPIILGCRISDFVAMLLYAIMNTS
jgi:hypothetical protein